MSIFNVGRDRFFVIKPHSETDVKFVQHQVRLWFEQKDPEALARINRERVHYELYGRNEPSLSELLSLVDLTEITSQPFPYESLLKLGAKMGLSPGEEVGLKNWLEAIQRPGFVPSICSLNQAFAGLQILATPPFTAQEVIWQLYKRAPLLFERKDPLYHEKLKEQYGILIPFGVKGLYLNKEGMLFGSHATDLELRRRAAENAWGVPFFLQAECQKTPLPERWLREDPVCRDVKDPLFAPFLSLLTKLVKENAAPQGFALEELYLSKGILYTLKAFSKGFLDFIEWEEIVVRISGGSREVYQELMQKSGLASHPGFRFWEEAMRNPEWDLPFEAAKRAIGDGRIVSKARLLADQARQGLRPFQRVD